MIFYKGCPLKCEWCCNPESQSFGFSIMYDRRKCKSFGDCLDIKPNVSTFEFYRNVCPTRAIQVSGEEKSTAELMAEIEKDIPFYQHSGGGVTLSGGEPLAQGENLTELLTVLKSRKLDIAIETSLHVDWFMVERCLGLAGTFLVDVKHTDPEKFKRFTGGNLSLVNSNLVKLAGLKENIIARIPVIPGFNHTTAEMIKIIDFIASLDHIREIHFLPYHSLGTEKYTMLGMEYVFGKKKPVDEAEIVNYTEYARNKGFTVRTGG